MGRIGFGMKIMNWSGMEGGAMNSGGAGSFPDFECRLRPESAFDSFSIASEAFSEYHRRRCLLLLKQRLI